MDNKIRPIHIQNCNCEDCKPKVVPAPNTAVINNNVIKLPNIAIRYDDFNLYTPNGVVNIPNNIYNVFAAIGIKTSDLILQDANSGTLRFDLNTLSMIVSTTMCMCIDNFMLTLDNLYSVKINELNNKFKPFIKRIMDNIDYSKENTSDSRFISYFSFSAMYNFIDREALARAIIAYISTNPKTKMDMYDNVMSFAVSYVNSCGVKIYNNLRNELTTLCENEEVTKNGNDIVLEMFSFLEDEFSSMMLGFTYEASAFSNNIIENFDILYNPAEFLSKKLGVSIPNFDYPTKLS